MSTRPQPTDYQGWMRAAERRMTSQERRPHPSVASDLLGPGIGPTAVEISDWNSDVIGFNGFFFSQPGAINSPDTTKHWLGFSLADTNGIGYQRIMVYRDPVSEGTSNPFPAWPGVIYTRSFYAADGSARAYSAWKLESTSLSWETLGSGGDITVTGTSFNPVPSLFVDLPVTSTGQVFFVNTILDVQHNDTGNQRFDAHLSINGSAHPIVLRYDAEATNNVRVTLSGRWRTTGLPVGTRRVQIEVSLSAPGSYILHVNNSLISAELTG